MKGYIEDILEYDSFGVSSYANIFQSFRDVVEADLYPDLETVANDLSRKGIIDRSNVDSPAKPPFMRCSEGCFFFNKE